MKNIAKGLDLLGELDLDRLARQKGFSYTTMTGDKLVNQQLKKYISSDLYNTRSKLARELGGLSHINRHRTEYFTGGGSVAGAVIGDRKAKKNAEKEAEGYGLKKGTLEYDKYIKSRRHEGAVKGAAIGGALGFGGSKGVDTVRGKVITDKYRAKYGDQIELGNDYMRSGKAFRGITKEEDINNIAKNLNEAGDYLNSVWKAI